ncbi:MAG: hypothetical protein H5U06_10525 [Candidatus Aminicenantes bacterium]|nr:hypothetical protein [Candidatus Aminicenantes bacterium]
MEESRVENKLKNLLQKNIYPILSIVLFLYILNSYNHYKLFFNKLIEIKKDINYSKRALDVEKRINSKLIECIDLIGNRVLDNKTNFNRSKWSLVILTPEEDKSIWITTIKIVNLIRARYPDIPVIRSNLKFELNKLQLLERLLLIDHNNRVLIGFHIDGKETPEELHRLAELIISKIEKIKGNY